MYQAVRRGFYSHYKGGLYFVLNTNVVHTENSERMVLYYSLHYWNPYVRPIRVWESPANDKDGMVVRFRKIPWWIAVFKIRFKKK